MTTVETSRHVIQAPSYMKRFATACLRRRDTPKSLAGMEFRRVGRFDRRARDSRRSEKSVPTETPLRCPAAPSGARPAAGPGGHGRSSRSRWRSSWSHRTAAVPLSRGILAGHGLQQSVGNGLHALVAGVVRYTGMGEAPLRTGLVGFILAQPADVHEDAAYGPARLLHDVIFGLVGPETAADENGGLATVLECRE